MTYLLIQRILSTITVHNDDNASDTISDIKMSLGHEG